MLEPSLTATPAAAPLYSVQANFFVAFFGGVFAALVFCALNARRLRRLAGVAWVLAAVGLGWSVFLTWAGHALTTGSIPEWLSTFGTPGGNVRVINRAAALSLFGLMFLSWRTTYKAQRLAGTPVPNPWRAGLTAIAISMVATFLFLMLGTLLAND